MSAVSDQMRDAGATVPAVAAVTHIRALVIELAPTALGIAVFGLFLSMATPGSFGLAAFGYLLFLILAGTGFNAAGVLLMDESLGAARRSFADALLAGLFAFGKALVVMIAAALALLVILLAVALLMWICKIPGIGPVLFFVVFPASAVLLGVLFVSFAFVLAPVAGPAIWSGESIGATLARVAMMVRRRLLGVLVRAAVLFALLTVTAMVLWAIALSGTLAASSLSLAIVGVNFDLSNLTEMVAGIGGGMGRGYRGGGMGAGAGGAGAGYGLAALIGALLIFAVVGTLLSLVLKKGWCLIYLQAVRDLDVSQVEAEMQQRLAQVRARAQAARERVQQQNLAARQADPGRNDSAGAPPSSAT